MAEHVVDLLKAVEADHQQRDFAAVCSCLRNHRGQFGVKRVAVDQTREQIIFRQVADSLGFPLAHRDVAQNRSEL